MLFSLTELPNQGLVTTGLDCMSGPTPRVRSSCGGKECPMSPDLSINYMHRSKLSSFRSGRVALSSLYTSHVLVNSKEQPHEAVR